MVGAGFAMLGIALWFGWVIWSDRRGRSDFSRRSRLLWALVLTSPLGFVALEAGWIVTEVGRQPWIIYGVMRTRDAVTPVQDVGLSFLGFALLYVALGITVVVLLRRLANVNDKESAGEEKGAHALS